MRPQHITAENACRGRLVPHPVGRFNEAAAYHCGKHSVHAGGGTDAEVLQ